MLSLLFWFRICKLLLLLFFCCCCCWRWFRANFQDQQRSWASRRWKARSSSAIGCRQWMHDGFMDSKNTKPKPKQPKKRTQNVFIYLRSMDEKTSQKATTRMRTRTQSSCWSFHYCCCRCCCCSSCCYCWSFFLGFGFVLWELSQTFFNWFLIFRDSQTKALNPNSVWDLIRNCRWQTQSGIRWALETEAGHNITVNAVLVAIVCLNIIETRFQWVNFEVCPATLWRRTGQRNGRQRKHN